VVAVVSGTRSEAPAAGMNSDGAPGEMAAMWATWLAPGGPNLYTKPASAYRSCVVHINSSVWPTWRSDDYDFPAFCKEMLHEYGHFEGYEDVGARRGTIQFERPDLARLPACEHFRLTHGHTIYTWRRGHPLVVKLARARFVDAPDSCPGP